MERIEYSTSFSSERGISFPDSTGKDTPIKQLCLNKNNQQFNTYYTTDLIKTADKYHLLV